MSVAARPVLMFNSEFPDSLGKKEEFSGFSSISIEKIQLSFLKS